MEIDPGNGFGSFPIFGHRWLVWWLACAICKVAVLVASQARMWLYPALLRVKHVLGILIYCSYGILLKIMPSHGFYTWSRLCPRSLDGLFGLWLGHVLVPTKGWGNHRPNAMESQVFPCWASRITSCRWRFSWSLLVDRFRWRDKPIALPGLHLSGWSCHTCQQFPDFLLSEDPVAANWGLQGSPYLPQLNWAEVLLLDDQSADPVFAWLHRCVYHCRNPDPLGPPVGPLVALVALARGECEVRLHEEFRQQSSQPLSGLLQSNYRQMIATKGVY